MEAGSCCKVIITVLQRARVWLQLVPGQHPLSAFIGSYPSSYTCGNTAYSPVGVLPSGGVLLRRASVTVSEGCTATSNTPPNAHLTSLDSLSSNHPYFIRTLTRFPPWIIKDRDSGSLYSWDSTETHVTESPATPEPTDNGCRGRVQTM